MVESARYCRCRPPAQVRYAATSIRRVVAGPQPAAGRRRGPAAAGRPARASVRAPRPQTARSGLRSRAVARPGHRCAPAHRPDRLWVGRRAHRFPRRPGGIGRRNDVDRPSDGAARAVDACAAVVWLAATLLAPGRPDCGSNSRRRPAGSALSASYPVDPSDSAARSAASIVGCWKLKPASRRRFGMAR